jgi:capsular exopolysaccharide synthesis family protein
MGSIEKALEKARQQRQTRFPAYGKAAPQSGADTPPAFVYEQTRVEPVRPKDLRRNRIIAGFAHDPHADIFRMLRVQALKYLQEGTGTTIGICSPNPGVGKSLVAANLAVSLALGVNHTVLLVDADLRRPSLQSYFGLDPAPGLTDYLLHDTPLPQCLVNPDIERLVLLPVGAPVQNSSEVLGSPKMLNLANELKARYPDRFVIYDLPPLLTGDDSLVFLPQLDGCMLVVEERKTREQELQRALELLSDARLIGTILNKSQSENAYQYNYY